MEIQKPLKVLTIVTVLTAILVLAGFGIVVLSNLRILAGLTVATNGNARAGFISREQIRCVNYESQATLLHLVLLNPALTDAQKVQLRVTIPLPSLQVQNEDGTMTTLNCDKIVKDPVPGLPRGVPAPDVP